MMGSTHLTTGFTAGAWFAAGAQLVVPDHMAVLAVPVVAYAALVPDLDHRSSMATFSLGPLTMAISWVLRRFVEHRGATHRIDLAPLVFGAIAMIATVFLPGELGRYWWLWGPAVALGVATHIWADARTISGVPWHGRAWTRGPIRTTGGKLRIGRSFRTGFEREKWLAFYVYRPVAIASIAGAAWVVSQ